MMRNSIDLFQQRFADRSRITEMSKMSNTIADTCKLFAFHEVLALPV